MKPVLLTDFGSTYTKLTAVDLDAAKLLGTAQAYTTVASDVRIGFQKALDALLAQTGPLTFAQSYACSSAAGSGSGSDVSLCRFRCPHHKAVCTAGKGAATTAAKVRAALRPSTHSARNRAAASRKAPQWACCRWGSGVRLRMTDPPFPESRSYFICGQPVSQHSCATLRRGCRARFRMPASSADP